MTTPRRPQSANSTQRPKSASQPTSSRLPLASPLRMKHIRPPEHIKACNVPERKHSKFCTHNGPNHPVYMTDKKKKHLERLKKKEEIRAAKNKLHCVLVQKLIQKFEQKRKPIIVKHVDDFVSTKLHINAQDLLDLEAAVRQDIPKKTPRNSARGPPPLNLNSVGPEVESELMSGGRQTGRGTCRCGCAGCVGERCATPLPFGTEWEALQLFQSMDAARKAEEEEKRRLARQKSQREALEKQMKETQERRKAERQEDADFVKRVDEDVEKFREEAAASLKKRHERYERERLAWERQIAADREAREHEKEMLLKAERQELQRIAENIEREKQLLREKKEREAEMHRAIVKENEENERRREEARQREHEEDRRLAKEYADRLDAEERAREAAFQKRMETLEKFAKWADEGPAGKGKREEEQRFEELLLKEQLAKEQRDKEREERDIAAKVERDRLMAKQNLEIIEEKARIQEEERKKDVEYAEKYRREGEEHVRAIAERRRAELEKQKQYGAALLEQIETDGQPRETMNEIEKSLNKVELKTIKCDPLFHSRVHHRLRMRGSSANGQRKPISAWA